MATATRARRNAAPVKEDVDEPDEGSNGVRQPTRMHELFAEFLNEHYDAGVTARQCAIFTSKRSEFRRSQAYQDYRAEGPGEADDEAEAKPTSRRRTAKADEPAEAKAAPARRARRGAAVKEAPEAEEAKPATKTAGRRRRSGTTGEDGATAKPAGGRRRRSSAPAETSEEEPF